MQVINGWSVLKFPVHLAEVFSGAKDFSANPVLGSGRLNSMGLHVGRKKLAHAACQLRRWCMRRDVGHEFAGKLQAQGVLVLPDFLEAADVPQLRRDVAALQQIGIEMAQPPATTRRLNLDANNCANYPALRALLNNKQLYGLLRYAAGYGGAPIVAVQCIHTDAGSQAGSHDPQTDWHTDTFHSTAKAWLFLHDVHADEGPFAYVPGSHRPTPQRLAWEKQQSLEAANHPNRLHAKGSFRAVPTELTQMGYSAPILGVVQANTLVVADTSGFHRRTPSNKQTVRVEIYLSLRRNPFFAGLYPSLLGLPGIRKAWAGLALSWYRWLAAKGVQSWRPSPNAGLTDAEKARLQR